jgi:hypothetical protein
LRWRVAKVTGWFRGRFGRTSPEDVTDFAKVLALTVLGIDPTSGEPNPASWKLSARLQKRLREVGGWPYDFAQASPNETEELFLDLWLVSYAFRVKRNTRLKPGTREAFVHQVEAFALAASLTTDSAAECLPLYRKRFAEYSTAYRKPFSEMNFEFAEAVTRNVFRKETNSVKAAVLIKFTTDYALISFSVFLTWTGLHGKIARAMTNPARS